MEFLQMRDFSEFCEQLHEMRLKFHKWDSCERTVALYYLMAGLPFANARFLQNAIEKCIAVVNTPDAQIMERNANDPMYISNLLSEHPQAALTLLLTHLPLLRPGNREAVNSYLKTIKRVLTEFICPPYRIYNECVEIMSYVFVHPAFEKEDKKTFKHLLKQVLNKVTPDNFVHSPVNESSDESISPNPEPASHLNYTSCATRLNRRSNSLTPAQSSSHESLIPGGYNSWSSQENLTLPPQKPRSYSLSNDKTLNVIAPQGIQSSSSETRLQDLHTLNNLPVMKSIVSWLKSLRLHKYSWVFNNLSYQQMLSLNDETLQAIGITKGARHKLLLSITKLNERSMLLTELEAEVMNGGDLNSALKKLKNVMQSPLQVTLGEDLPSQFVKVMGKVCTQLLMLRQPTDETLVLFTTLCERAESLDTFSDELKRKLIMWKGQLNRGTQILHSQRPQINGNMPRPPNTHGQFMLPPPPSGVSLQQIHTYKSSSYPNMQNTPPMNAHRHSVGSVTLHNQLLTAHHSGKTLKSSSGDNVAPNNNKSNNQFHVRFQDSDSDQNKKQILKNIDIESSLESLCLQMMEHALGP